MRQLAAWTERRSVMGLAALLALLVTAPSLGLGFVLDDYAHREFVQAHLRPGKPPEIAIAMFGQPRTEESGEIGRLIAIGLLPWWTSPHFSLAFFRPFSVATHFFDYALYPDQPVLMHLHNMLWYAALVLLVGALYRRLLSPGPVSALALLLYAIDEAHAEGAAWIASRNTLLTACFAVGCLLLFDRARRDGSLRMLALAGLAFAFALGCSEGAIAVLGYLLAHALFLDRAPLRARAAALLPFALLLAGYTALYRALDYGARGTGIYLDPLRAPLRYLAALPSRGAAVFLEQVSLPTFVDDLLPEALHSAASWLGGALLLAAVPIAISLLRRSRTSRFFLAGALLSTLPICALAPAPRLLFLVGVGGSAFGAELIAEAVRLARAAGPRAWRAGAALVAGAGILLHALLPLVLAPLSTQVHRAYDHNARATEAALPASKLMRDKTLLLLNVPNYWLTMVAFLYRAEKHGLLPKRAHILGSTDKHVRLTRTGPHTLELEPEGGYLNEAWSHMVRDPEERFSVGQTVLLSDLAVSVLAVTPDGRPARVLLIVPEPDSTNLLWAAWNASSRRFAPIALPAVGDTILLDAASQPRQRDAGPEG